MSQEIGKNDGVAHIKEEYIIPVVQVRKSECEEPSKEHDETGGAGDDSKANSLPNKKKKTGRNHHRPKYVKEPPQKKLCRYYWSLRPGETPTDDKCKMDKCPFSHDYKTFLQNKGTDLGDECHNFSTYGFCSYGLVCRFGGCHIESNGSVVDEEKLRECERNPPVRNTLTKEVQVSLRKRTYDFSRAGQALKEASLHIRSQERGRENGTTGKEKEEEEEKEEEKEKQTRDNGVAEEESGEPLEAKGPCSPEERKRIGAASDEDLIRVRRSEKKKVDWTDKLYLAPLTTVGNLPFRRVCKRLGADVTCSEMALATSLLQGSPSEWALVKRHASEDLFGVQLCGHSVESMTKAALLLEREVAMDFVDINMGCPIDLIYKQGAGSALLRRVGALRQMVEGMTRVLTVPLTLKMRTSIYKDTKVAHSIIQKAKLWDVSLVTVHGRSKEQRYLNLSDWSYVKECAVAAHPLPLFGSGDVLTYQDYVDKKKEASVAGVMIGRGALMKPWLFTEIKERRAWDISSKERLDVLNQFTNFGLEHWGSDSEGIEKTRRFLLEWLSFLHRYIPIGLLRSPPQRINQRPPLFRGRDDLETIMASNKVTDWVKISEMLLGRVPADFAFLPKHKANSWN